MGRSHRHKPTHLGRKLHAIRQALDLTQEQLIKGLCCDLIPLHAASISMYEAGTREPPLLVLLAYARLAGVTMEMLVDDDMDLPERLPAKPGQRKTVKPSRTARRR